ncbi:MAG: hypothetical protein QM756_30795 [Polyangiaceae bacterium]
MTTSRIAVSPLTPSGRQFVYAIDQYDTPTASVMAFDVSPGASERTPIVRPGGAMIPESPDRILFAAAPRDISFIKRDRPKVDPATGNVVEGLACDPTPGNTGVGTQYRSASDYSSGARAVELRGVFGTALLTNGQIAVIDVEDFDAPCRRPTSTNTDTEQEDFRGCKSDPVLDTDGGRFIETTSASTSVATVSDEVSCRMVEPHRARASSLGITDSTRGIHAPSLRSFPQLKMPESAPPRLTEDKPKLRGVDFTLVEKPSNSDARRGASVRGHHQLRAQRHGQRARYLARQHRAKLGGAAVQRATRLPTERHLDADLRRRAHRTAASRLLAHARRGRQQPAVRRGRLHSARPQRGLLRSRGVRRRARETLAESRFGLSGAAAASFGSDHADYVVLTGDFPVADDDYWEGGACGGRDACVNLFGTYDPKVLSKEPNAEREFRIERALHQWLELQPRLGNLPEGATAEQAAERAATLMKQAECCFPSGAAYVVRASKNWVLRSSSSGVRDKLYAVWNDSIKQLECQLDDNPRKKFWESRVFETCSAESDVGCNRDVCSIANSAGGLTSSDSGVRCLYSTPTARFVVYAGKAPSVRGMTFNWQTVGGFASLRLDFSVLSAQVSPSALYALPELNWLTVVDSTSLGLVLLSLDSLAPLAPPLN